MKYILLSCVEFPCQYMMGMLNRVRNTRGIIDDKADFMLTLQIVSPLDKDIFNCIKENLAPWQDSWDVDFTETSPLCVDPYDDIHTRYQEDVKKLCYFKLAFYLFFLRNAFIILSTIL